MRLSVRRTASRRLYREEIHFVGQSEARQLLACVTSESKSLVVVNQRITSVTSIHKHKLVGVEQDAAGVGEAVLSGVGDQGGALLRAGRAAEGQAVGGVDLPGRIAGHLAQVVRKELGLPDHERVVE